MTTLHTIRSLPPDKAEEIYNNKLREEYQRGFKAGQQVSNGAHEKLHTALSLTMSDDIRLSGLSNLPYGHPGE